VFLPARVSAAAVVWVRLTPSKGGVGFCRLGEVASGRSEQECLVKIVPAIVTMIAVRQSGCA